MEIYPEYLLKINNDIQYRYLTNTKQIYKMWNYVVLFLRNCKGYVLTEGEIHDS